MQIALIHSAVTGAEQFYQGDGTLHYRPERITAGWQPCIDDDDVGLVPNDANHVVLYEARARLHRFLERGGVLLLRFCGFFTPGLAGNQ